MNGLLKDGFAWTQTYMSDASLKVWLNSKVRRIGASGGVYGRARQEMHETSQGGICPQKRGPETY